MKGDVIALGNDDDYDNFGNSTTAAATARRRRQERLLLLLRLRLRCHRRLTSRRLFVVFDTRTSHSSLPGERREHNRFPQKNQEQADMSQVSPARRKHWLTGSLAKRLFTATKKNQRKKCGGSSLGFVFQN